MKLCLSIKDLAFPVQLHQQSLNRFTVVYGQQMAKDLPYTEAALELGSCIMHSLSCEGKLDDRERT